MLKYLCSGTLLILKPFIKKIYEDLYHLLLVIAIFDIVFISILKEDKFNFLLVFQSRQKFPIRHLKFFAEFLMEAMEFLALQDYLLKYHHCHQKF